MLTGYLTLFFSSMLAAAIHTKVSNYVLERIEAYAVSAQEVVVFDDLTFLVVEDSDNMCELIRAMLKAYGAKKIYTTHSVRAVSQLMDQKHPDIVLLDWMLWPETGADVLRELRVVGNPHAMMPVVMLSAEIRNSVVSEAMGLGIDMIVSKPVSAKNLYDRLVMMILADRKVIQIDNYLGPITPAHRQMIEDDKKDTEPGPDDIGFVEPEIEQSGNVEPTIEGFDDTETEEFDLDDMLSSCG